MSMRIEPYIALRLSRRGNRSIGVLAATGIVLTMTALLLCAWPAPAQEVVPPGEGVFLVASRQIQDPRFRESVILLFSFGNTGAAGLIINKSSDAKLSSLFEGMRRPDATSDRLYYGGPVEPVRLLILMRTADDPGAARPLIKGVSLSTSSEVIWEALVRMRAGRDYRLYRGYAGWARGQLEREIGRGDWHVIEADVNAIFHEDEEKVWPLLIRKGEEIMVQRQGREAPVFAWTMR